MLQVKQDLECIIQAQNIVGHHKDFKIPGSISVYVCFLSVKKNQHRQ